MSAIYAFLTNTNKKKMIFQGTMHFIWMYNFIFGVDSDAQMAHFLGVKPQTISNWKKRDSPDYPLLLSSFYNAGVNLHWLLTGEGMALLDERMNLTYVGSLHKSYYEKLNRWGRKSKDIESAEELADLKKKTEEYLSKTLLRIHLIHISYFQQRLAKKDNGSVESGGGLVVSPSNSFKGAISMQLEEKELQTIEEILQIIMQTQ